MLKTNIPKLGKTFLQGLEKDQLIDVVLEQNQSMITMWSQLSAFHDQITQLQAQVASLQKNSTNSSKPPSSDMPGTGSGEAAPTNGANHHRNSRQSSNRKPGGQPGHTGTTRQPVENPDETVVCMPEVCSGCGQSLAGFTSTDRLLCTTQVADIPPIIPTVTEYRQFTRTCVCGHTTIGSLPDGVSPVDGGIQIGPNASSFLVYLNSAHHLPFQRLTQVSRDIFHFPLSPGTIDNKLEGAAQAAAPLRQVILQYLRTSPSVGSDETGVRVAGRRIWQWVWQNAQASYYVISKHRDYQTAADNFGETYRGCLIHDCYSAQNNTQAGWHQLCHAHLLRDLQFVADSAPGSGDAAWAHRMQGLLIRSQRARDHIWGEEFNPEIREQAIDGYYRQLEQLACQPVAGKEAIRLQKRFRKHEDKILYFMTTPDVPPDNNGSERAIRNAKVKQKVSGGFRSMRGAERQAALLSVIETAKKQDLNVMETIQRLLSGQDVMLFRAE